MAWAPPFSVFAPGTPELDDRDDQHQDEQHHGDRAGVAVLGRVDEGYIIDVVHQGHGGVAGAALGDICNLSFCASKL